MNLQKRKYVRSKAIRDSAKNETCTWPGCDAPAQCWAHSNLAVDGKGTGIKSEDIYGAYLCTEHHNLYDSRPSAFALHHENKQRNFHQAMKKSWKRLIEKGVIKIS